MCKCLEKEIYIVGTSRGEVYLDLNEKQIYMDDFYDKKEYHLLEIKYCPLCGEKL